MSIIVNVQDECKQPTVQCLLILAVNHGDNFDDFATSSTSNNQSDPSEEPLSSESDNFFCGECRKPFKTKEKLRYHRRTHAKKECPFCRQMFSSKHMSRHAKTCPMKVPVTPVTNSMDTTEDTAGPSRILQQQSADQRTSEAIGDVADTASSTQHTATVDLGASSSLDIAASSSASSFAPARDISDSAPDGNILDTSAPALTAQDTSNGAAQLLDMADPDLTEQETSAGTAQILDTEQDGKITIGGKIFFKNIKQIFHPRPPLPRRHTDVCEQQRESGHGGAGAEGRGPGHGAARRVEPAAGDGKSDDGEHERGGRQE